MSAVLSWAIPCRMISLPMKSLTICYPIHHLVWDWKKIEQEVKDEHEQKGLMVVLVLACRVSLMVRYYS